MTKRNYFKALAGGCAALFGFKAGAEEPSRLDEIMAEEKRKRDIQKARTDIVTDKYGGEILPGHVVMIGVDPFEMGPMALVFYAPPSNYRCRPGNGHWIAARTRADEAPVSWYWSHNCESVYPRRRFGYDLFEEGEDILQAVQRHNRRNFPSFQHGNRNSRHK